jgi:hypothetical protein
VAGEGPLPHFHGRKLPVAYRSETDIPHAARIRSDSLGFEPIVHIMISALT